MLLVIGNVDMMSTGAQEMLTKFTSDLETSKVNDVLSEKVLRTINFNCTAVSGKHRV